MVNKYIHTYDIIYENNDNNNNNNNNSNLLYLIKERDIYNYADDNTIYACDQDISVVLKRLEIDLNKAMNFFNCNFMVANSAKFQVIFLGTNDKSVGLNIDGTYMTRQKVSSY